MRKVKITEAQVAMIQKRIDDMDKKKVLKINEGQYDRLFKGGFNNASKTISKNLKDGGIKENDENSDVNPLEFAQELIVFIKDIIANPKKVPFSTYWDKLGITRKELFSLVKKEGLLTMMVDEANLKSYKAKKIGFRKGIKELYKKVMDRQLTEDGEYPTGTEFDSNAPWNQDDNTENRNKGVKCKKCLLKYVYFNERLDDLMIFKDDNGLYAYSGVNTPEEEYADFMDFDGIVDDEAIYHYVNVLLEEGLMKIELDPEMLGDGKVVKIGPELKQLLLSWYGNNDPKIVEILNRLPESTGSASSGAYVGGMSSGPIKKDTGMSPKQAMQDIHEDMARNQFKITWNLDDNGGDTSPFFNEFHEVQQFMDNLKNGGIVTGVKVSKTDNNGMVAKEFTYDFDGQEWQKRDTSIPKIVPESETKNNPWAICTASVGRKDKVKYESCVKQLKSEYGIDENAEEIVDETTSTTSVGGDSGTFAFDAPAGDGSAFWNAGNKQNKGNSVIKRNGVNENFNGLKVGQIYVNGNGRAKIENIIDNNTIQIRRWGDVKANTVNINPIELSGWNLLEGKKVMKLTESQIKMLAEYDGSNRGNRYVAEMDFYIYADNDDKAKAHADIIARSLDDEMDNGARITKLVRQPQGTMGSTDVGINGIS